MSRYVDKDKLGMRKINRYIFVNKDYADGWNAAIDVIRKAPSADVVEVKHGYWKGMRYCSICEAFSLSSGADYCPHCGAKMDGERKDEE